MNLPNKLTVLRMAMIPLFLLFMLLPGIPNAFLWAAIVFALASATDFLDGYLARKYNLITDFGKFMDPLADKLLVVSALCCFVESGWVSGLFVFIILAREFLVTSVRLIAAGHGTVIAADLFGKLKTVIQIVWILYTLVLMWLLEWLPTLDNTVQLHGAFFVVMLVLQGAVVLLTVFSGVNYLWKNRALFADAK